MSERESWIDHITQAEVTATRDWLFIQRGPRVKAIPRYSVWSGTQEHVDIKNRWKEAHDDLH